jgi:hypothetical protein
MALFLVSWILCKPFYVVIVSIGTTKPVFIRLVRHVDHIRYLILNFGNVASLDFALW